jgi:hypothetical protein
MQNQQIDYSSGNALMGRLKKGDQDVEEKALLR